MKRKVFIKNAKDIYTDNCYICSGLNIYDYVFFLEKYVGDESIFIDIPYIDNDYNNNSKKFYELEKYIITAKEKSIVKKLYEKERFSKYDIEKKTKIETLGTSVILKHGKDKKILDYSCEYIIKTLTKKKNINNTQMFIVIHDFDWQALCYFDSDKLFKDFINYFEENIDFQFIENWDMLPN